MDDDLRLLLDAMQAQADEVLAGTAARLAIPAPAPAPRRRWWHRKTS